MRIIAGSAKGHPLKVPREVSRPTTDRVRESVFGILTAVIPDARVLDLYAGSGALGIEALSRGAASCTFVEQNRGACRVVEENLKKTGCRNGRVIQRDVAAFLRGEKTTYDLIFADPPYADGLSDPARDLIAIEGWNQWLADDGFLVLEREAVGELPEPKGLSLLQSRDYGRSRIAIYQLES
ncbi:16S rRNA (guanine(966)-N(2))-methyltransferase RsmD [Akkermansiaceae bacterium]|jgi:16S rRNA (guanine(966)-N(2))-methyltransferase RsmD|nr:16S rRNA (guanine(966)-N(2))-methyltransferase RsmD [Akkermansiaceae bacterium]